MQVIRLFHSVVLLFSSLLVPCFSFAKVTGQCGECHTMHNSQDGGAVAYVRNLGTGALSYPGTPNLALLKGSCVGCHTGVNASGDLVTPYVFSVDEPTYNSTGTESGTNTLAGGNFYWVYSSDSKGHNVEGITAAADGMGTTPPGFNAALFPGGLYDVGERLTCAGTNGCHGTLTAADPYSDLAGAHHGADSTIDGLTIATSFRFLMGVKGKEDGDWEFQPATSAHNQYLGEDRNSDGSRAEISGYPSTISGLCANCHGNFHTIGSGISDNGDMTSPWLRHPTDFDMGSLDASTEYKSYNDTATPATATYSLVAPLASDDVSSVLSSVDLTSANGTAIVMCISCHRAHGSPNDAILRWDYKGWPGNAAANGCNVCHTAKD